MKELSFDCTSCGQTHVGLPAITYPSPLSYFVLTDERKEAATLDSDFCVVDDSHFFVRCVLSIPIIGHETGLEWGVWGSLSRKNFDSYRENFEANDQSKLGGMFSYLDCLLNGYPDTLNLRCAMHPQDDRMRPLLQLLDDQDHPLVHDQRSGIPLERAIELIMPALHPRGNA